MGHPYRTSPAPSAIPFWCRIWHRWKIVQERGIPDCYSIAVCQRCGKQEKWEWCHANEWREWAKEHPHLVDHNGKPMVRGTI